MAISKDPDASFNHGNQQLRQYRWVHFLFIVLFSGTGIYTLISIGVPETARTLLNGQDLSAEDISVLCYCGAISGGIILGIPNGKYWQNSSHWFTGLKRCLCGLSILLLMAPFLIMTFEPMVNSWELVMLNKSYESDLTVLFASSFLFFSSLGLGGTACFILFRSSWHNLRQ